VGGASAAGNRPLTDSRRPARIHSGRRSLRKRSAAHPVKGLVHWESATRDEDPVRPIRLPEARGCPRSEAARGLVFSAAFVEN